MSRIDANVLGAMEHSLRSFHTGAKSITTEAPRPQRDSLTSQIIGAGIEVHRQLGPGLLESAYRECLCWELHQRGLSVEREMALPLVYKGVRVDAGYRLDLIVEGRVLVELKAIERLAPVQYGSGNYVPEADRPSCRAPHEL